MVVSWNAVEGATGYNVKVGSKVIAVTGTTLDLATADVTFTTGEVVRISVMATGTTNSQYSDELVTYNQAFTDAVLYKNGYVYWTPVVGDGNYEIKVNNGNSVVVANDSKAPIVFTQAGLHTIAVRFASKAYTSEWVSVDVMVYSVTFDVRQGAATAQLFVAADDLLALPTSTRNGYTFDGWYTKATGGTKVTGTPRPRLLPVTVSCSTTRYSVQRITWSCTQTGSQTSTRSYLTLKRASRASFMAISPRSPSIRSSRCPFPPARRVPSWVGSPAPVDRVTRLLTQPARA